MRFETLAPAPPAALRGRRRALRVPLAEVLVMAAVLGASTPTSIAAQAQGPATAQHRNPRVPFDRNGASFTSVLPFDQRFSLVNAAPAPLLRVTTWYARDTELPRSECGDLSARTRIRAIIQTAVAEKLGALPVTARDSVSGALTKKLATVHAEVFDAEQREALKRVFADTLAKHPTNDSTALAALREVLTERMSQVPIRTVNRTQWTRSTDATPSDTFSLDVRPLAPNRDFTFCVESVESLPAGDSATHVGRVAAALRKTLRDHFNAHGDAVALDSAAYRTLQQSLRNAVLPTADSIVTPPNSLLAPAPPMLAVQHKFAGIANAYGARCFFAGQVNAMAATTTPRPPPPLGASPSPATPCGTAQPLTPGQIPLGLAVRELARDPGLIKLVLAPEFTGQIPRPDTVRIAAAAGVALALRSLACDANFANVCVEAGTIGFGQTPLNNPRPPTEGNANVQKRSSSAELRPWADNLDSTMARLRELQDLVNSVAPNSAWLKSLGLTVTELGETRRKIESAQTAAESQRIHLRNVMEELDAMDAAVAAIASEVVARDLKRVGIATTSSASYETRARWHVGQDVGVLHAFRGEDTRETAPYLGVSIYLRPVNKRGELPWICPLDLQCTALTFGVTTSKFEETDRYSGVLGGIPFVVGVGTRLGDFLRVSYNAPLVYTYRFDPDGTAHRRMDRLNSVTLSLDADIREILGALGSSLFGK